MPLIANETKDMYYKTLQFYNKKNKLVNWSDQA